jgi:PEP-CTERM motif
MTRRITPALPALLLCFGILAAWPSSQAAAITIDGARMVTAPSQLVSGSFDDGDVLVFAEAAGFTLVEALKLNGSVIPAGTMVDVYYVIFDPPGQVRKKATVTFDVPILGVAFSSRKIRQTDFLGKPGTSYSRFSHRGFEAVAGTSRMDRISFSEHSIDFRVRASDPGDAVRVIVAHVPIPEPSTALLLGAGCAGLAALGARKRPAA